MQPQDDIMKLCIISPTFPYPGESPQVGPDNVVYNLVKGLVKLNSNMSIDIVTIPDDVKKAFTDELFPRVRVHYLPKLRCPSRSFGDPIIIKKFLKMHAYDLIHSHYPIALAKVMDINTPKILTLHGIFHHERNFVKNPLTRLFYHDYNTYMLKKNLPKLDGFVAISPYVIDELKEMGVHNKMKNIFQINNPIDNSFFDVPSNHDNNMIFYPARITKRKNQLAAIHAIELVKNNVDNFKLIFTGDPDERYLEQVNDAINEKGLTEFVEYLGKVSRDEILKLYSKASIVYLLSNQETQPMAILEAMSTGTPVIASKIKSIEYLVKEGVTGYLVDPNDSEKIAEYTIELLNDNRKRIEMGECARKIAQKQYHPDVIVEQTLKMYEKVMGLHNG